MFLFITDSMFYYQKNKDFLFKNDLYKWTLKPNFNELKLQKKIIDKKHEDKIESEEIIAIISPSNYKLLFDLKELNVRKFYYPELYSKGKHVKIDFKKVDSLFEDYLKRSYLSFLNYEKLQRIGLNRIEQYIILGNIAGFNKYKNKDNLILNKNYTVKNIIKIQEKKNPGGRISLLKAIKMIALKYSLTFDEASKFIIQLYGKLNISDPFHEDGFMLLKKIEEYPELNILFLDIIKESKIVEQYRLILTDDKEHEKEIIINKLKEHNKDLSNYYSYQEDEYFIGKYIIPNEELFNVEFIYNNLSKILPIKDYILTLKSLIKLEKVKLNYNYLYLNKEEVKLLKLKNNYEWISQNIWKDIYGLKDFSFNNILDELNIDEIDYKCPCCENTTYHITPMKFFCKNNNCKFVFDRTTLKIFEVKPILEEKMKEALIHKKVFVRNKHGKNFIAYLRNNDKYFYLSLK